MLNICYYSLYVWNLQCNMINDNAILFIDVSDKNNQAYILFNVNLHRLFFHEVAIYSKSILGSLLLIILILKLF